MRGAANLRRANLCQAIFDLLRRHNMTIAQYLFAYPVHLIVSALLTQIDLAYNVIPRPAQFGSTWGRPDKALELAHDQPQRGLKIVRVQPSGDYQVPGILEKARCAVDRVSQAAVLAKNLE